MGDPRGRAVVCDDRCGCPCPCPGGLACRCRGSSGVGGLGDDMEESMVDEHKRCSCGEHCGCNPCTCSKSELISAAGSSRAFCKCGDGCTCFTCAS